MLRSEEGRATAPVRERTGNGDDGELVELLTAHASEISALVTRLARIRKLRWRLGVKHGLLLGFAGAVLFLVSVAVSLAAAWLLVTGLTAGLTEALAGRRWLAELCAGGLLFGALGLLFVALRSAIGRGIVRALEKRDGTAAH